MGGERAGDASGFPGGANRPPVADEPVAEVFPRVSGKKFYEVGFHFFRVVVPAQPQAAGKAADMGVHDHSRIDSKRIAENDICGFSANAGKAF